MPFYQKIMIHCPTIVAAFPFMTGGLNDEKGMYLGQNNLGDVILFNPLN